MSLFPETPDPVKEIFRDPPPPGPWRGAVGNASTCPAFAPVLARYMSALLAAPDGLTDAEACEVCGTWMEVAEAIANRDLMLVVDDGERGGKVVRFHVRNVNLETYENWVGTLKGAVR